MRDNVIAPHPRCTNPSVTPLRAATAPLSGEPRAWEEAVTLAHSFTMMLIPWFSSRPLRAVCILYIAAYNVRAQPAHLLCGAPTPSIHPDAAILCGV